MQFHVAAFHLDLVLASSINLVSPPNDGWKSYVVPPMPNVYAFVFDTYQDYHPFAGPFDFTKLIPVFDYSGKKSSELDPSQYASSGKLTQRNNNCFMNSTLTGSFVATPGYDLVLDPELINDAAFRRHYLPIIEYQTAGPQMAQLQRLAFVSPDKEFPDYKDHIYKYSYTNEDRSAWARLGSRDTIFTTVSKLRKGETQSMCAKDLYNNPPVQTDLPKSSVDPENRERYAAVIPRVDNPTIMKFYSPGCVLVPAKYIEPIKTRTHFYSWAGIASSKKTAKLVSNALAESIVWDNNPSTADEFTAMVHQAFFNAGLNEIDHSVKIWAVRMPVAQTRNQDVINHTLENTFIGMASFGHHADVDLQRKIGVESYQSPGQSKLLLPDFLFFEPGRVLRYTKIPAIRVDSPEYFRKLLLGFLPQRYVGAVSMYLKQITLKSRLEIPQEDIVTMQPYATLAPMINAVTPFTWEKDGKTVEMTTLIEMLKNFFTEVNNKDGPPTLTYPYSAPICFSLEIVRSVVENLDGIMTDFTYDTLVSIVPTLTIEDMLSADAAEYTDPFIKEKSYHLTSVVCWSGNHYVVYVRFPSNPVVVWFLDPLGKIKTIVTEGDDVFISGVKNRRSSYAAYDPIATARHIFYEHDSMIAKRASEYPATGDSVFLSMIQSMVDPLM